MSITMDAESYLKSGSNELRVLEYDTSGISFGINILKVNRIIATAEGILQMPESHPAVTGVLRDRGDLIPIVNLASFLGLDYEEGKIEKIIVTEFFGKLTGFQVDHINWIHHFRWEDLIDAQQVFSGIDHNYLLGIVKPTEDNLIQMLDYETLLLELNPNLEEISSHKRTSTVDLKNKKILIAEDSPAVRAMLINEFTELGLEVHAAGDGVKGWELFQQVKPDLVISDVEMPQMDGLALTLKIRQSDRPDTPVIVYSSIGDAGMKDRAKYLKADAHITKLELDKLIKTVGSLINGDPIEDSEELETIS